MAKITTKMMISNLNSVDLSSMASVGNSEAAKEGDPCPLALDPWPQ